MAGAATTLGVDYGVTQEPPEVQILPRGYLKMLGGGVDLGPFSLSPCHDLPH